MAQGTQASLKGSWYLLGPAFVAAIAYVDPGNVAANVSAGAQFGYLLLWVIVVANVLAGPGAVPVGETRPGHRALTARGDRQADEPPAPAGLLGPGRTRGDSNRCGRSRRRGHRLAHPVRFAAADRRDHHRGGVLAVARGSRTGAGRSSSSASSPACCSSSPSASRPVSSSRRRRPMTCSAAWCRDSAAPKACCWPPPSWAPP